MEYYGKLYGKIGNKYFDTGKTSSDFDSTSHQLEKLEAEKKELLEALEEIEYKFRCENNSSDESKFLDEIESLIQKHKPCEIK